MKKLSLVLVAACSNVEHPSPTPPPSWGVPISGGTMLVTRDGHFAVVADPDRDRIVTVDLDKREVAAEFALREGDEPGRLVEDGAGRIHVALRRGGDLLTLANPTTEPTRRAACPEPRGVAWQQSTDTVYVACTGGELVSFAAAGGDATRTLHLDRDLRDVIIHGDTVQVTRFRTAELLTLDASGLVIDRATPPIVKREVDPFSHGFPNDCPNCSTAPDAPQIVDAVPAVAWRAIALADGGTLVSHQRAKRGPLSTQRDGYGAGCGGDDGPVEAAVTVVRPGQAPFAVTTLVAGGLPVDVAISNRGDRLAFVTAGSHTVHEVFTTSLAKADKGEQECGGHEDIGAVINPDLGAPTSVAYTPNDQLVSYYPEAPAIVIGDRTIMLTGTFGYDSGRAMFHRRTFSGLACAGCHPEGRDDGLTWEFQNIGIRRTQSLAGNILQRAPYHWNGDMPNLDTLMHQVFEDRMSGGQLTHSETTSLGPWLARIPAPKPSIVDAAAVERGKALFETAECSTCHGGSIYTNNMMLSVGTGGYLKVPSLVGVAARAPFMHDGCATTLRDRFGTCGGANHGKTSQLSEAQLADLIAFLESL